MADEYKLRLGDMVEIDGEPWIWEGVRRGTEAKLRHEGTADDWLIVSMPELLASLPAKRTQRRLVKQVFPTSQSSTRPATSFRLSASPLRSLRARPRSSSPGTTTVSPGATA